MPIAIAMSMKQKPPEIEDLLETIIALADLIQTATVIIESNEGMAEEYKTFIESLKLAHCLHKDRESLVGKLPKPQRGEK